MALRSFGTDAQISRNMQKSLVTIEVDVYTNMIVQARGKFNRDTTEEENKVIEAWNKKYSKRKDVVA